MDSHDGSGIPVPRLATIAALLVAVALGAWIWKQWRRDAVGRALFDADAPGVERIRAVEFWAARGPEAVPRLVRGLTHENAEVREYVLVAFSRLGRKAQAAVPAVLVRLADPDEHVREAAVAALMRIDPALQDRAPRLVMALKDEPQASVRAVIVSALLQIGAPALPDVLGAVETDDPGLRLDLIRFLQRHGRDDPRALAVLRSYANDPGSDVRRSALLAMGNAITFEESLRGLGDEDPGIVLIALNHLYATARNGECLTDQQLSIAVPAIAAHLSQEPSAWSAFPPAHGGRERGDAAVAALAALGPRACSAAADLARVLRDANGRPRMHVVRALIGIGAQRAQDDVIVPAVRDEILDVGNSGDYAAAVLLRDHYPQAAERLVPDLLAQLDDNDVETRLGAAAALYGVGPAAKSAVPSIIAALEREDVWIAPPLLAALERIGSGAEAAVPFLVQRARRHLGDASRFEGASRELDALGGIGVAAEEVLALLERAAIDENAQTRCSAIGSMGRIRFPPGQVLDALMNAMRDSEPNVRAAAAMALGRVHSDRDTAVATLRTMLMDENLYVRKAAVQALGRLGPDARPALADLRTMLGSAARESAAATGFRALDDRPQWFPEFLAEAYMAPLGELLADAIERIEAEP
jgi:HEAT repeat protein